MDNINLTPIERAAKICGGITNLANGCGVTAQAAFKWCKKQAPAERCLAIEKLTHGAVTRFELRPDIFGTPKKRK